MFNKQRLTKLPWGMIGLVFGIAVEWTTANEPKFDRGRSARRSLPAGNGGGLSLPILINAESELTGLRIIVEDDQALLPIDAIRL